MTPRAVLAELHARGVKLTSERDRLRYRAPSGTMTPDLREQLLSHKAELLLLLEPMPLCAICGEPISGEGVTVICGGAHHDGCAPPVEAQAG